MSISALKSHSIHSGGMLAGDMPLQMILTLETSTADVTSVRFFVIVNTLDVNVQFLGLFKYFVTVRTFELDWSRFGLIFESNELW